LWEITTSNKEASLRYLINWNGRRFVPMYNLVAVSSEITTSNKEASLRYLINWNGRRFVPMYNLVAVSSTPLVLVDPRTRAHHSYKFRTITTNTSHRK